MSGTRKKTTKELIDSDLARLGDKSSLKNIALKWLLSPSFRFLYCFRKVNFYGKKSPMGFFWWFMHRKYMIRYGIEIPPETTIGKGFYIGHLGGIAINKESVIGSYCSISCGVVLGVSLRGEKKGCPTIGDRVWIGPNAVIVGKVMIGDNVLIAPNSYVNVDVPSNSIVIGNPCKIIPSENATEGYIKI